MDGLLSAICLIKPFYTVIYKGCQSLWVMLSGLGGLGLTTGINTAQDGTVN